MRVLYISLVFLLAFLLFGCQKSQQNTVIATAIKTELTDSKSGGLTTVTDSGTNAYSDPFENITSVNKVHFNSGNLIFNQVFVNRPGTDSSGVGPVFNNVSCVSCHVQNGRGNPLLAPNGFNTLVLRLSIPGTDVHGGPLPVPGFGLQLQDRAIAGVPAEGQISISYAEQPGNFADGEVYSLRRPRYTILNPYTALPQGVLISPRMATVIFGLGLLESIPEDEIQALARQEAANSDGVHGRPNMVWDVAQQKKVTGRYGWKANETSVLQQTARALSDDIGITSSYFPVESSDGQSQAVPVHGPEISDLNLNNLSLYIETLAPPARRNQSATQVQLGYTLFIQAKCSSCHATSMLTGTLPGLPELSNQTIRPYTDMLLHNMGPGLNDGRPDFDAQGGDWRTSPLWGLGLNRVTNGNTFYLHDGRARNLTEAILWHDGEAANSRAAFVAMTRADRTALLAFLNNL